MLTTVRFLHYVSGIAWVGATLVLSIVVFPAIDRCPGHVRGPIMRALSRRIAPWEVIASVSVIVSGALQAILDHRLDEGLGHVLHQRWGQAIGVGAVCAVLLVALGAGVLAPTTLRFVAMEEEVATDPRRGAMSIRQLGKDDPVWWATRRRLVLATCAEVTLAMVAVFSMAVARGS